MKKYFLWLLAIPFSLIAFSNAVSITCEDWDCTPSEIEVWPWICNNWITNFVFNWNVECEDEFCYLSFFNSQNNQFSVAFLNWELDLENSLCMFEWNNSKTFTLIDSLNILNLNWLTLNWWSNTWWWDWWDDNTWSWDDNTWWWVISDWFWSFTPVITWVKDTIFQLIPLVVFIWIWVLIVTLWFFAIRWLVNWIVWKINSNFSSKRD